MNFTDKYTTQDEKNKPQNKEKKVVSDDCFAMGEALEALAYQINKLRMKNGT